MSRTWDKKSASLNLLLLFLLLYARREAYITCTLDDKAIITSIWVQFTCLYVFRCIYILYINIQKKLSSLRTRDSQSSFSRKKNAERAFLRLAGAPARILAVRHNVRGIFYQMWHHNISWNVGYTSNEKVHNTCYGISNLEVFYLVWFQSFDILSRRKRKDNGLWLA